MHSLSVRRVMTWLCCLLVLSWRASAAPPQAADVWGAQHEAEVDIVYTGGIGGIGVGHYRFDVLPRLQQALEHAGIEVQGVTSLSGVLVQDGHVVWSGDRSAKTLFAFATGGAPTCTDAVPARIDVTRHEQLVRFGSSALLEKVDLIGVNTQIADVRRCHAGGAMVWWVAPRGQALPHWQLDAWDVRLGYLLDVLTPAGKGILPVVGRPQQDAARRFWVLQGLLQATPGAMYVDAGDFVDGSSLLANEALSVHRSTDLEMLERLAPTALVPGRGELAGGARHLLAEARAHGLPYVATNWSTDDSALELPWAIQRTTTIDGRRLKLAFLGVIDPAVAVAVPKISDEGVHLGDPITAVRDAVDRLILSDDKPDVIIVIGQLAPELLAQLRSQIYGVALLIGDTHAGSVRVGAIEATLQNTRPFEVAAPLSLPLRGVSVARLRFHDEGLASVRAVTVPVTVDLPADPSVSARITRVRAKTFAQLDDVLVDASADDPTAVLRDQAFAQVVCEAMRDASGAEIGMLAPLADGVSIPGPLTALLAAQRLQGFDHIEVHRVDGSRLKDLLLRAEDDVATRCGASTSQVNGRSIDVDRVYRLVTTDRTRRVTALGELLETATTRDLLRPKSAFLLGAAQAQGSTLREVVLRVLRAYRTQGGQQAVTALVNASSQSSPPLWLLDLNQISLDLSRFSGTGKPELSALPDAQASNPSSLTVGTSVDAKLGYLSSKVRWEFRTKLQYRTIRVDDQPLQESADDIQLSTAIELPTASFGTKSFRFLPYSEVLWDSEFRAQRDVHDAILPRQSDLYLTLGISASTQWLKQLRLGGFVSEDLARFVAGKTPEFGGRLNLETSVTIPPMRALRFDTNWDLRVWSNTPFDDASDMRVRLMAGAKLVATPIRWLQAGIFIQGYIAKGRVPGVNDVLGISWTAGATLSASSSIDLTRPGRGQFARKWRHARRHQDEPVSPR